MPDSPLMSHSEYNNKYTPSSCHAKGDIVMGAKILYTLPAAVAGENPVLLAMIWSFLEHRVVSVKHLTVPRYFYTFLAGETPERHQRFIRQPL